MIHRSLEIDDLWQIRVLAQKFIRYNHVSNERAIEVAENAIRLGLRRPMYIKRDQKI
jgi:hypothetical protein